MTRYTVGDRVTVVHGHTVPGQLIGSDPVTVRAIRADGMVSCEFPSGGTLWVAPELIDAGDIPSGHQPRHRSNDPDTSRLAAEAAAERLTEHQWTTLAALVDAGRAGLIDHEHEARTGLIPTSAGKRRKELERVGLVEATEHRRRTQSQRFARVYRVTARGVAVYQHHSRGAA